MKKIINTILATLMAFFVCPEQYCCDAVKVQVQDPMETQIEELKKIAEAAVRNNCRGDDFIILLAIRRAENGRPGREFGIKHRLCDEAIKREPHRSLDIQAGWAAATIVKNRRRWKLAGSAGKFIDFLADRYVPIKDDPKGNEYWKINVRYFYEQFKNIEN